VGINCLACTDHNLTEGAFELKRKAPFQVIVGEEIDTGEGEIIGLFLKEWIAPNQGIARTIHEIKMQGGLVYLPHPLSITRKSPLDVGKLMKFLSSIDLVEVFNSRTLANTNEREWLDCFLSSGKVVKVAGSDAHSPYELGNVLIEMKEFNTKDEFLNSLATANFSCRKTSPLKRVVMNRKIRKILRRFL
jgi:predicted metal-dependent phosphoesterase TrpH